MSIVPDGASGPGPACGPGPRRRAATVRVLAAVLAVLAAPGAAGIAQERAPKPAASPPAEADGVAMPNDAEVVARRAEAAGQLQAIDPTAAASRPGGAASVASQAPAADPLRPLFQERLRLIDEYERASAEYRKATHPEPSPERQADEARSELGKLQALLNQAGSRPEVLIPQTLKASGPGGRPPVGVELKEAIEAATTEAKECRARLEALRAEATGWEARQNARRAERDRLFQAVVAIKAQGSEKEPAGGPATATPAAQRMAQERRANAVWGSRIAARRLQAIEARIMLESRMASARELGLQVAQAQAEVAARTVELLQARYSAAAEQQQRLLKEKAAAEETRASRSDDPLERFRARRRADLLDIEARVVKHEEALATSPPPSLDEQTNLADRATNDFQTVKQLLDDGRVSRLDAIRLNNDFRRIGPERDRLLRNELAVAEARLQYYEDALTSVEIELLQDSLHDRYELEILRESLPPGRHAEVEAVLAGLERGHRSLLIRRRKVLEQLADRTAQTLDQIARRLAVLDEEYAFIRTHIFWVRDREPIGPATVVQGMREGHHLVRGLARLAQDSARLRNWGRPSAEFLTAALAALVLPVVLFRVRRLLGSRLSRAALAARPPSA